jgi:hypothetical protein
MWRLCCDVYPDARSDKYCGSGSPSNVDHLLVATEAENALHSDAMWLQHRAG